jgi:hypothetical protein
VFFGKADQILDLEALPVVIHRPAGVAPEHLVHLAENYTQVGFR